MGTSRRGRSPHRSRLGKKQSQMSDLTGVVGVLFLVALGIGFFVHAAGAHTVTVSPTTTASQTVPPTTAAPPVSASPGASAQQTCHAQGSGEEVLPDPNCTPGTTDPTVTQANIDSTICRSGWTDAVRPPESSTEPLKLKQMAAYGYGGQSPTGFEEDHLIPLELGGSPTSPQNLWPEAGASPNPKDAVESAANHAVCDGQMPLVTAQQEIASNWIALGHQLGVD
jgi:hypothetical protein